jgi:hypothetical protein
VVWINVEGYDLGFKVWIKKILFDLDYDFKYLGLALRV